jgi:hypothetical protein
MEWPRRGKPRLYATFFAPEFPVLAHDFEQCVLFSFQVVGFRFVNAEGFFVEPYLLGWRCGRPVPIRDASALRGGAGRPRDSRRDGGATLLIRPAAVLRSQHDRPLVASCDLAQRRRVADYQR